MLYDKMSMLTLKMGFMGKAYRFGCTGILAGSRGAIINAQHIHTILQ